MAYVSDPDGTSDICGVEMSYEGDLTGVWLYDDGAHGDFSAGDDIYGLQVPIGKGTLSGLAGLYLFDLIAKDCDGNVSDPWPYICFH